MRHYCGTIFLLAFLLIAGANGGERGRSMRHEVKIGGTVRSYILYVPAVQEGAELPLMIVLHGGLGNAAHMERTSGMNEVADAGRFLVAYPDGTGGRIRPLKDRRTWNAGRCCGQAVRQNVEDTAFITAMIDQVRAKHPIDSKRIYVAGHSNGAMLAYRLACEIPDKIAAVIAVSGTVAVDNCDRAKDVPVLHIHGENDKNVPFAGGIGEDSLAGVAHRSVPDSIKLLTAPRECTGDESRTVNGIIRARSYSCRNGAPVSLYLIKGGGHAWPGSRGNGDAGISASRLAWEFAKQFRKK